MQKTHAGQSCPFGPLTMPGGQSSSLFIPLGNSLSSAFLCDDKSTGCFCSFLIGVGVDELRVEEVVDKVGERGVAKVEVGVLLLVGVAPAEAAAAAAAAKAAAAMNELCKNGEEKKVEAACPRPPKVGLRMLSIEKAKDFS